MKQIVSTRSIVSLAFVCGISALGVTGGAAAAASKTSWKVSGELEEACSCQPACPCWFKSLPSRMTCDGAQVIFITKGHYGKVPLEGLAIGQFVQSPEHKSMFESFGNWKFENSNYMYNKFTVDNKQYEKHEAMMAKKMGKM